MRKIFVWVVCWLAVPVWAQAKVDSFAALQFLEGTWDANVQNSGAVKTAGRYSFMRELDGHVLARHATSDAGCTAPASFDCKHGDLMYVYEDRPGAGLKAIYFDNEGHVIHDDVVAKSATSVEFVSQPGPGPTFRLAYELAGGVMTGRFQMQAPGQTEWRTYLEWSGSRK